MQLEEGVRLQRAGPGRTEIADAPQLIADRDAVLVGGGIGLVEADATGVDQAAHHVGLEACALLVGEEGDGNRPSCDDLRFVERAHDFKARQHAVVAVVAAAGAHRVDVAAGHDWRQIFLAGAQAHHVADGVDPDIEARRLHPAHDQIAPCLVLVGERQPRATAALDGADPTQLLQRTQQALVVDSQTHWFPHPSLPRKPAE